MTRGGDVDQQFQAAVALQRSGRLAEAETLCRQIIATEPRHHGASHMAGVIALMSDRLEEGVALLEQSLAVEPRQAGVLSNLGNAYLSMARPEEALACLDRSVALSASHAVSWYNRGNACRLLNRAEDALASYQTALRLNPAMANAHNNCGLVYLEMGRPGDALPHLDRAITLEPRTIAYQRNRAHALQGLQRFAAALETFQWIARRLPGDAQAHAELGTALASARRYPEAISALTTAWRLEPSNDATLGALFQLKSSCCDWDDRATLETALVDRLSAGGCLQNPLVLLLLDRPALALAATRRWADTAHPEEPPRLVAHDATPLRIAYVSADFREHPVSRQLVGVLERHDRSRFHVTGISLRTGDDHEFSRRVRAAFDEHLDLSSEDDATIAEILRTRRTHIAVDLMGLTLGMRPGVFAARAAPVQVNYLGFAGTVGSRHLDYIIGDATVLPAGADDHLAERAVRLPHSFMPMDLADATVAPPTRGAAGLPARGAVLCAFTQAHKIHPRTFEVWLKLLAQVPDSILWLRAYDEFTRDNLRAAARAQGVAPERLVFAPYMKRREDHLARHQWADLFLDSAPLNAHSTFADALAAGVPAITCAGDGFAARVGASLLGAAGLAELITRDLMSYERLARELLTQPARLRACRDKLARLRATAPLFDMTGYTRALEAAFQRMHRRACQSLAPAAITIDPREH